MILFEREIFFHISQNYVKLRLSELTFICSSDIQTVVCAGKWWRNEKKQGLNNKPVVYNQALFDAMILEKTGGKGSLLKHMEKQFNRAGDEVQWTEEKRITVAELLPRVLLCVESKPIKS